MPFDLNRLEAIGAAAPVLEGVVSNVGGAGAQFAVAATGTLVYLPGIRPSRRMADPLDRSSGAHLTPAIHYPQTGSIRGSGPKVTDWRSRSLKDHRHLGIRVGPWRPFAASRPTPRPTPGPVFDADDGSRLVSASTRGDKSTHNLSGTARGESGRLQRLTDSKRRQRPARSIQAASSWRSRS